MWGLIACRSWISCLGQWGLCSPFVNQQYLTTCFPPVYTQKTLILPPSRKQLSILHDYTQTSSSRKLPRVASGENVIYPPLCSPSVKCTQLRLHFSCCNIVHLINRMSALPLLVKGDLVWFFSVYGLPASQDGLKVQLSQYEKIATEIVSQNPRPGARNWDSPTTIHMLFSRLHQTAARDSSVDSKGGGLQVPPRGQCDRSVWDSGDWSSKHVFFRVRGCQTECNLANKGMGADNLQSLQTSGESETPWR